MIIAEVIGTVVATRKHDQLVGYKIQVVQPIEPQSENPAGEPFVAVDVVGAGAGEQVIVVRGSAARYAAKDVNCPVDATIVGIIDQIDIS